MPPSPPAFASAVTPASVQPCFLPSEKVYAAFQQRMACLPKKRILGPWHSEDFFAGIRQQAQQRSTQKPFQRFWWLNAQKAAAYPNSEPHTVKIV
ncbi:hypothetical protein DPMN_087271 [Dreissena polymorpha]|uniref:Uncharacterized protein n=1 Tax=Dreissena polymorpha TaxID=45954 RepID=A0A9D4KS32_DREPO|nr:hypothetical protein DPMN_087271 [Dreissena polymorpha]